MKNFKKILVLGIVQCLFPLVAQEVAWQPPIIISSNNVNASDPRIGLDAKGNAIAAWVESGIITSRNLVSGNSNWNPSTTIPSIGASSPQLVVDAAGNATLIWLEGGVVQSSSQPATNPPFNQGWSSPTPISTAGASSPKINVDLNSGNVVAIWLRNGFVETVTHPFNSGWSNPTPISGNASDSSINAPFIAIGANGAVLAVWHALDSSTNFNTVYTATQSFGATWNPHIALSNGTYHASYPKAAVNVNGDAVVAWFRYNVDSSGFEYSNVIVEAITQLYQGNASMPSKLSSKPGVFDPALLTLKVRNDMNQNIVVGWTTSEDGSTFIYEAATLPYGQNWSGPTSLIGADLYAYSLDLAANQMGQVFAVYMGSDPTKTSIGIDVRQTNIYANNSGWHYSTTPISVGTKNAYPRAVSMSQGSTTHTAAIWLQSTGSIPTTVVQAAVGLGALYPLPSAPQINQIINHFGVFQEYTNHITWGASNDLSTTQYLVFRNGSLLGTVPATGTLEFYNPNQPMLGSNPPQPVTYGIAAFNDNNEQSQVVEATFQ